VTPKRDPELDSLLGAYALDALDEDEKRAVEDYAARNPAAQAEIDELRETAGSLALAPADDPVAPPELWRRIEEEINSEPRDELASRRKTRRVELWVVPVAAALALVLGVAAALVLGSEEDASLYEAAVDDGASEIPLVDGDAQVATIALRDDGTGVVRNASLDTLSDDEVYQLWAVVGNDTDAVVISAGVLGSDVGDATFTVAGPVEQFMITVEDAPGVPTSDREPVAQSA
jgi:hypothetical protein